jgi:hypothetical protein
MIRSGAKLALYGKAEAGAPRGVAPVEGSENH